MKLYYYEYETSVFLPFKDSGYELEQGFLIESPFGVIQYFDRDELNEFDDLEAFKLHIKQFYPKDGVINIVELE